MTTRKAINVGLGDYVRTDHYGYVGRVHQVHPYGCPESEGWLKMQAIPVDEYKDEPWVSILVHRGGAVTFPSALVKVIEPFEVENRSLSLYFRDPE